MQGLKHENCRIGFWDKLGICVSTVCVVHCILTPLVFIVLPAATELFHLEEVFHIAIFFMAAFVAFFAMYMGMKVHRKRGPMIYMFLGLALLGVVNGLGHDYLLLYQESFLSILGSSFLIRAHLLNHVCHKQSHAEKQSLVTP